MKMRNQRMHSLKRQSLEAPSLFAQIQSRAPGKMTALPVMCYQEAVMTPYKVVNKYWYTMCFQLIRI